jgi:glucokinase
MKACVDIGGTKVAVSLNTGAGLDLVGKRSEPTAKTGSNDAVARQVIRMVDEAALEVGIDPSRVQRVGVSSAGPFVLNAGLVELATPNICGGMAGPARGLPNDWMTATMEAPLRRRFTESVRVENDAVSALEAERRWGALQGFEHCAYVTWSTGVGMGLCVDGHVVRGKNGNAGHGGHMFVADNDDALCGCGNIGDLEALVAGNAVARRFGSDAAAIMQKARAGDAASVAVVDELCRVMGRALYNIVAILDLQRISLGGSVFLRNQEILLPRLRAQLAGKLPALTDTSELVPAGLGEAVGDYAALALMV